MQHGYAGLLLSAIALAQAPDNAVWATNFSSAVHSVTKIDPIGQEIVTLNLGGFSAYGLAIDPSGNLWAGSNGSTVGKIDQAGTTVTTFPTGSFPQSVASDSSGNIWVANRTSNSVTKLDPAGNALLTVPLPTGTSPIGIVVDLLGQVWVSGFHSNTSTAHTLTVLDSLGNITNTYTFTSATAGFGFSFPTADLSAHVWVANQAQNALLQVDMFGSLVSTTTITSGLPRGCAVDGLGYVWLANQGFAGSCVKIDPAGTIVATFLPPSTSFTTVSIDGNGDPWVFGFSSPKAIKLWQVDATPLCEVPMSVGGSAWGGDSSGFHLARLLVPGLDFDNDGFPNGLEIQNGTNPFTADSTPIRPQPIQSGLAAPGATVNLTYRLRPDAGLGYLSLLALGNGPIVLPDLRTLPLSGTIVLLGFGVLDANGDSRGAITLPNNPLLSGVRFFTSYVTLDPAASLGLRTISNSLRVMIQ